MCPRPSYNRGIENHLLTRELELLNPTPESLSTLLAEDFQEFASSGRIYTRSETIEALQTNPAQTSPSPISKQNSLPKESPS